MYIAFLESVLKRLIVHYQLELCYRQQVNTEVTGFKYDLECITLTRQVFAFRCRQSPAVVVYGVYMSVIHNLGT